MVYSWNLVRDDSDGEQDRKTKRPLLTLVLCCFVLFYAYLFTMSTYFRSVKYQELTKKFRKNHFPIFFLFNSVHVN